MKIEIEIDSEEANDIIKAHVLTTLPIETANRDVDVTNAYGSFIIRISDKEVEEV